MKAFAAILIMLAVSACAFLPKQANVCSPAVKYGCSNYDGKIEAEPAAAVP